MRERPIDRPVIRYVAPNDTEPPGWRVTVNFDSGTRQFTWLSWREAVRFALRQCGPRERPDIRPRVMPR